MPTNSVRIYDKKSLRDKGKKYYQYGLSRGGKIVCYFPYNSVQVILYDIHSPQEIPNLYDMGFRKTTNERYLRVLACRNGKCDFIVSGENGVLNAGHTMYDFSIGDNGDFDFTSSFFKGVEITVQLASFDKESTIYRQFKKVIKAMSLPEREIFLSDYYICTNSVDTENLLDFFIELGFDGVDVVINKGHLLSLGYSLGKDFKKRPLDLSDNQLIVAKDIYDCLTKEFEKKWVAQYFADKYRLSNSTVKRYFKKVYGYGFKEYQTKVKMECAAEKLITTDKKITDIAFWVGFSDLATFTAAFKSYYKCTPSEYRLASGINS